MDLCILTLDGAQAADSALDDMALIAEDTYPWLRDICVISRSTLGRLTISAAQSTSDEEAFFYEEGELAARAMEPFVHTNEATCPCATNFVPTSPYSPKVAAILANDVERRCFHMRALKDLLKCDSSALMLVAPQEVCVEMARVFAPYRPRVLCRKIHGRVGDCLELLDSADEAVSQTPKASGLH
jgi:hypothetical protein